MDKCLKNLSDQLWRIIGKKGCSISVAADFMGISRNELSLILNCKSVDVKLSTLIRISDSIEIPIVYLICPDEARKAENEDLLRRVYDNLRMQLQKGGVV